MPSSRSWTAHLDLYGSPECDYHAHVTIGSTVMNLVIDTGSANTAVISDLCNDEKNCTFVNKPYLPVPPQLKQFYAVNASYGNTKLRSSWKGFATGQVVSFDGIEQAFSRIDVIAENQNFLIPRCPENQGIWGLAYPTLQTRPRPQVNNDTTKTPNRNTFSEQQKLTLFDAIRREKGLPNAFTVQLCPKSAVEPAFSRELNFLKHSVIDRHTENAINKLNTPIPKKCPRNGHLWLGGYPTQSIGSDIVWTPLYHNRYYEVKIDKFVINGEPVTGMKNLNMPRTIIDTGTKDITLSDENLDKLLHALWHSKLIQFDSMVTKEHEKAFWIDHLQLTIPKKSLTISNNVSIAIAFEGNKQVSIPIENILNIKPLNQDWMNISWTGFSSAGGDMMASTVLGNSFLLGKTVIFDRGLEELNSHSRVGFADAAACCKSYSTHDVDILLSVDSISTGVVKDQNTKTAEIVFFLLVVLSGIGFLLTFILYIVNFYREKRRKKGEIIKHKNIFKRPTFYNNLANNHK